MSCMNIVPPKFSCGKLPTLEMGYKIFLVADKNEILCKGAFKVRTPRKLKKRMKKDGTYVVGAINLQGFEFEHLSPSRLFVDIQKSTEIMRGLYGIPKFNEEVNSHALDTMKYAMDQTVKVALWKTDGPKRDQVFLNEIGNQSNT